MAYSYYRHLENRILELPPGAVVTIADFTDIAVPKTVSKMLKRLSADGAVRKVMRSLFWKPDGMHAEPAPNEVAKALARENGWALAPSKDTALHLIGMVEASPKVWTYVTDGTYRKYHYGSQKIFFTHTGRSFRARLSEKTALFIQSLKAYGKEKLTDDIKDRFTKLVSGWDLKTLAEETKGAAAWIREATRAICRRVEVVNAKKTEQRI